LLGGERAGLYRGRSDRCHAEPVELGEPRARLDDVHLAVGDDVDEAQLMDLPEKRAAAS
jgi:hypothetical protein